MGLICYWECDRVFSGWLRGLVEFGDSRQELAIACSCGCGASVNSYSRYARGSERNEDGYKIFAMAIKD